MDALLLALRNSEVARVIDMGTLEYFLDGSYALMVHGDTVDLSKLWEVLEHEPGIEPSMVFPSLLAYKSWEQRLGVTVLLPGVIQALPPGERKQHEARIPIPADRLDQLLNERKRGAPRPPQAKISTLQATPGRKATKVIPIVIGVLLLAMVTLAGWWLVLRDRGS